MTQNGTTRNPAQAAIAQSVTHAQADTAVRLTMLGPGRNSERIDFVELLRRHQRLCSTNMRRVRAAFRQTGQRDFEGEEEVGVAGIGALDDGGANFGHGRAFGRKPPAAADFTGK
jgi:hypothetical protein